MLIVKLLLGLGIAIALLYAVHRLQRRLRGGGSTGGLVSAGIRKSRGERADDVEKFIADFRAQQSPALARQHIDAARDHQLGIDAHPPVCMPALPAPGRLLYLLLKSTLPDHHVLPNARLGDFVREVPPALASCKLEFLLCNRAFAPVSAVLLAGSRDTPPEQHLALEQLLRDLGVHVVRLDADALPRRDQVRALVLGKPPPPDRPRGQD